MRRRRFKGNDTNAKQSIEECGNNGARTLMEDPARWQSGHSEEGQVARFQHLPASHEGSEGHKEVAEH